MREAWRIEPAAPGDLEAVMRLEAGGFGPEAFSRRQLRYLMTRAKGAFFVARGESEVVGYVSVLVSARHRQARVYSLLVSGDWRGRGLAGALLERAVAFARASGLRAVFLEVRPDNLAAVALYRRHGFVSRAVFPGYYRDGAPAESMALRF